MNGKEELKSFKCKDAGHDCEFHVCAQDEDEVVNAAQDHARRAHGKNVSSEEIRPLIKTGAMACG